MVEEPEERRFKLFYVNLHLGLDRSEPQYLRTGDLEYVDGGELYATGRVKDLIILRGRNHHPQDIELTAELAHPALQPGSTAAEK